MMPGDMLGFVPPAPADWTAGLSVRAANAVRHRFASREALRTHIESYAWQKAYRWTDSIPNAGEKVRREIEQWLKNPV